MRSFHSLHRHHHRHLTLTISACLSLLLIFVIVVLGLTILDVEVFLSGLIQSALRVGIAYIVSLVLAILMVIAATSSKKAEEILIPIFDVLQSFPSFALFPLLVVWFGKSSIVTILILIVTMIWPMLFTVLTGKKEMDEELLEAAVIYQAKGLSYYRAVFFPLLLPSIVTGSIIAWGEAWETIIAAEIIVNVSGVGTYLATAAQHSNTVLAVGIFALLTVLYVVNKYVWLKLLKASTKYEST